MSEESNTRKEADSLDQLSKGGEEGELDPKERLKKVTHIALMMSYDLIDKLRYWEKEALDLPEDQIAPRLEHLLRSVKQLRSAYVTFSEPDF